MTSKLRSISRIAKALPALRAARALFDAGWYARTNPDLSLPAAALSRHYRRHGWQQGRSPHPLFEVEWYLKGNPDVAQAGLEPLLHYLRFGWQEDRAPHPLFSPALYLEAYPDVARTGAEPLTHYLTHGWKERRNAYVADPGWVRRMDARARQDGRIPLSRFLRRARMADGREVQVFDAAAFDRKAPAPATKSPPAPITRWIEQALQGHSDAEVVINPAYYRLLNPDLAGLSDDALRRHYKQTGRKEGRIATPPNLSDVQVALKPNRARAPAPELPQTTPQYSAPLIISGFHRSGTSMTANLFHNAGLHLGNKLLGANPSNPYGHFEDTEVVAFHDRVLARSGTDWQAGSDFLTVMERGDWRWIMNFGIRKSVHPAWGYKDPRNCLFLPQWAHVFPDMRILYVFRPGIECVHSLKRRAARTLMARPKSHVDQRFWTVEDLALKMYLTYARAALRALESFQGQSCVVSLDAILGGRDIVGEVRSQWGYPLQDAAIGDIYDNKAMSRSGPNETVFDTTLLDQLDEVEARFRAREALGFVDTRPAPAAQDLEVSA